MSCGQMLKYSLSKLVMEFVGTMWFTMFFTSGSSTTMLLGLWILNIFFWKISGSHFNPAVSFAMIFRKDEKKMGWKLALSYIVAQMLGATVGALLVNFYTFELPILDYNGSFFMRALTQELLVSFIFVFFFLSSVDNKLFFSRDVEDAISCFIIASAYVGARAMFAGDLTTATLVYGAVANPAIALGIEMSSLFSGGFSAWRAIYLYPTVPFAGAFLAVLFYEMVYKRAQAFMAHDRTESGNNTSVEDDMGEHD